MRKGALVMAVAVGAAAILTAGTISASNMGFKLNYGLRAVGAESLAGDNTLGLPYYSAEGVEDAATLQTDIGFAETSNISRFDRATGGFPAPYTGRKGGGPNFGLTACEGYFVKMNADVDYLVIGSHDPARVCSLAAAGDPLPGGGTSFAGDNFYAPPYHTTAETAADLQNDIGFDAVSSISEFDRLTGGFPSPFTGRKGGGPDFNLVRGKAYFIKMNTTVDYTPSHY